MMLFGGPRSGKRGKKKDVVAYNDDHHDKNEKITRGNGTQGGKNE